MELFELKIPTGMSVVFSKNNEVAVALFRQTSKNVQALLGCYEDIFDMPAKPISYGCLSTFLHMIFGDMDSDFLLTYLTLANILDF